MHRRTFMKTASAGVVVTLSSFLDGKSLEGLREEA